MRKLAGNLAQDLLMKEQQVALFAHLRSRIESKSDEALTSYLNSRLPSGSKFTRDSVRRWASGLQVISKPNQIKLAQALSCSHETLSRYFKQETPQEEFFTLIDTLEPVAPTQTEAERFDQAVTLVQGFSLPMLGRMFAVIGELFAERWNEFATSPSSPPPQTTFSSMVQDCLDECIEQLEGGITEARLRAIALGEKPTVHEVELLSTVLPATLEELEELYRKEHENGHRHGCQHPN